MADTKDIELVTKAVSENEKASLGKEEQQVPPTLSAAEEEEAAKKSYAGYIVDWFKDPFMTHMGPLFNIALDRPLEFSDMGRCQEVDSIAKNKAYFREIWLKECADKEPLKRSLSSVIFRYIGRGRVGIAVLLFGIQSANMFVSPLVMKALLLHFEGHAPLSEEWLYFLAALCLISPVLAVICKVQAFAALDRSGFVLRNGLMPLIFESALNLSPSARSANSGTINTVFASDAQILTEILPQFLFIFYAPLQVGICIWLLYRELGDALFMSFAVIGVSFPVLLACALGFGKYIRRKLVHTDGRVKLTKEIVNGIRIIKYYSWEDPFGQKLKDFREKEIKELKMVYLCWLMLEVVMNGMPVAMPVAVFYTFAKLGNDLTYATIFTSLQLFVTLVFPLQMLTGLATTLATAKTAIGRITDLFNQEMRKEYVNNNTEMGDNAIMFENASFAWELEKTAEEKKAEEEKKAAAAAVTAAEQISKGGAVPTEEEEDAASNDAKDAAVKAAEQEAKNRALNTLPMLNFNLKKGKLTAIVGPVGCGKSSMINSLLGEMYVKSGSISVNGTIAYHNQESWILNSNIRDNITFGKKFDQALLDKSIEHAALKPDMEVLPAGLDTEIGERGINLSGGQKARISLARCLYSEADINLLDDPLSAVDANVCDHLFNKGIKKMLCGAGKTVLLVTHQVHLLEFCDFIVVLNPDGTVKAACEYKDLAANGVNTAELASTITQGKDDAADDELDDFDEELSENGEFTEMESRLRSGSSAASAESVGVESLARSLTAESESSTSTKSRSLSRIRAASITQRGRSNTTRGRSNTRRGSGSTKSTAKDDENKTNGSQLVSDEERGTGLVKLDTYKFMISSGGWEWFYLGIMASIGAKFMLITTQYFLAKWGEANVIAEMAGSPLSFLVQLDHLHTFAALGMIGVLVKVINRAFSIGSGIKASRKYHDYMLERVIRAPISWFDVTPAGRITNRFTGDLSLADQGVSAIFTLIVSFNIDIILNFITIAGITEGTFLFLMIPLVFVYYKLSLFFRHTKVEVSRLVSISKSPVFIEIQQSLSGITSLRAYDAVSRFQTRLDNKLEAFGGVFYVQRKCESWVNIRVEMVGSLITFFVVLMSITTTIIKPQWLGPAISLSNETTMLMNLTLQMTTNLEGMMAGIERIAEYAKTVPIEDDDEEDEKRRQRVQDDKDDEDGSETQSLTSGGNWKVVRQEPPASWPTEGKVEFIDVHMRYRDQALVLKGVDFTVRPKEKVGIAGRTGSGKSTVFVTLFRMEGIERGRIEIDGIDIATIPVHTLRSKLCIIPQDPVMFTETLRRNVDPFDHHTDEEIIAALESVQLKEMLHLLPDGLQSEITEGGENLSVGQRQLICFARALLKKPKIIVLDEATAAIDNQTDSMIQEMIHERFKDCTVLTIAHRLHTIIDSDRIFVMDQGRVAEADTPAKLKLKDSGIFKQLWDAYETAHH